MLNGALRFDPPEDGVCAWLGLMSGTSGDGIDVVRVEVRETGDRRPEVLSCAGTTLHFEPDFAAALRDVWRGTGSFADAARWDVRIGERFAEAAVAGIAGTGPVDGIALSGHTFAHLPAESPRTTLQLGAPAIVAERTGVPVLSGFRTADVARGGEGAPLVPAGDRVLFGHLAERLAVVNVGGISNVTWLERESDPRAVDAGPGNLVLDAVHRSAFPDGEGFDRDGACAAAGAVDEEWLANAPAFSVGDVRARADRSTGPVRRSFGREEFGNAFVARLAPSLAALPPADRLRTLAAGIARRIAATIQDLAGGRSPERVLIGGGGAHHRALRDELSDATGVEAEPLRADLHGVSADLREAAAFAILCHEWVYGRPGSFPGTTGALPNPHLGSWTLPGGPLPR